MSETPAALCMNVKDEAYPSFLSEDVFAIRIFADELKRRREALPSGHRTELPSLT